MRRIFLVLKKNPIPSSVAACLRSSPCLQAATTHHAPLPVNYPLRGASMVAARRTCVSRLHPVSFTGCYRYSIRSIPGTRVLYGTVLYCTGLCFRAFEDIENGDERPLRPVPRARDCSRAARARARFAALLCPAVGAFRRVVMRIPGGSTWGRLLLGCCTSRVMACGSAAIAPFASFAIMSAL